MRAFIEASKQAESVRLRRNRVVTVLIGVLVMFLVAGSVAWWNQDRLKKKVSAWTKVAALEIYAWTNVTAINATQERALKSLDLFKECRDCLR